METVILESLDLAFKKLKKLSTYGCVQVDSYEPSTTALEGHHRMKNDKVYFLGKNGCSRCQNCLKCPLPECKLR